MKLSIGFPCSKINRCLELCPDIEQTFTIYTKDKQPIVLKKFNACLISQAIFSIVTTDPTCVEYNIKSQAESNTVIQFFNQIIFSQLEVNDNNYDDYLYLAKEFIMEEVSEELSFYLASQYINDLEFTIQTSSYHALLKSLKDNVNLIPEKWLISIPKSFLIDLLGLYPEFTNMNIYVRVIAAHRLPYDYISNIDLQKLDLQTIQCVIQYLIETNNTDHIPPIALYLAGTAVSMKKDLDAQKEIIENGIDFDPDVDCSYIKTGRSYVHEQFWFCNDCCHGNQIICKACMLKCHQGHNVVEMRNDISGFCDCGAGDLPTKCQCMKRSHIIKRK